LDASLFTCLRPEYRNPESSGRISRGQYFVQVKSSRVKWTQLVWQVTRQQVVGNINTLQSIITSQHHALRQTKDTNRTNPIETVTETTRQANGIPPSTYIQTKTGLPQTGAMLEYSIPDLFLSSIKRDKQQTARSEAGLVARWSCCRGTPSTSMLNVCTHVEVKDNLLCQKHPVNSCPKAELLSTKEREDKIEVSEGVVSERKTRNDGEKDSLIPRECQRCRGRR
jgi:hypothetical protein